MRRTKAFIVIMIALMLTFSITTVAYAATLNEVITEIEKGLANEEKEGKYTYYQELVTSLQEKLSSYTTSTAPDAVPVTIDGVPKTISQEDQAELLAIAEAGLKSAKNSTSAAKNQGKSVDEVKDSITDMLRDDFNIKADTSEAAEALEGFKGPIGLVIGILAYIVIIGMGLFTALDICFIVIPIFRGWYTESAESGSKLTGATGKNGEAKLRWISDDAVYAVKVATVEEGKSPLKVYMFKRTGAYIIIAIVIFMLLTGNVQIFVNIALDLIAGAIEKLQKLAN